MEVIKTAPIAEPATLAQPIENPETVQSAPIVPPVTTPEAAPATGAAPDATSASLVPVQVGPGQIEFQQPGSKASVPVDRTPASITEPKPEPSVPAVVPEVAAVPDTAKTEAPNEAPTLTAPPPSVAPPAAKAAKEPQTTETTAAPEVKVPMEPTPSAEGPPAPVAALAGRFPGKLIMLVFWSSDAENIADTFNWLNNMHDQYSGRGLQILAVNQDPTPRDGEVFAVKNNAHFSVIYDRDRALSRALWVSKLPATYLLNDQGVLLGSHLGFVDEIRGSYEDELRRLLHNEQQK